jgi:rRNA maturation protein Nop10
MPFCRKCGRRLVEYSEVCTDCGQSTTAPIINTKRIQPSQTTGKLDKKIAKAIIPDMVPVQIKVIVDKPAKVKVAPKAVSSPVQAIAAPKSAAPVKIVAPIRVAPAKAVEPPKPVLSAKHIVKPKKATQTKPLAPFTIAYARPVAGLEVIQRRAVAPKQVTQLKPIAVEKTVTQPKQVTAHAQDSPPAPVVQPLPIIQVTPFAVTVEPPQPKPIPVIMQTAAVATKPATPAPVYPPHEIIQSKVSIKEDILAHPEDYEKEAFEFDLKCHNGHFFKEGTMLPVSKGKAYCPQCGERLSKPKPKKRRYRRRTHLP